MAFFRDLRELVKAYRQYDPATTNSLEIWFLYPGVRAWIFYCLARTLLCCRVPFLPRFFSELGRFFSGIDIHPGARLGRRVLMDHGAGIVIGETAVVEDDVLIYQGVTLGGTSLERSKRHPTVEHHCVLGAGAKILGNIRVGEGSRIGANSVVVKDVPPYSTVVGIPGKIVVQAGVSRGEELEHGRLPDPVSQKCTDLEERLERLEKMMKEHLP